MNEYIEELITKIMTHIESNRRTGRTTKMIENIRVWDTKNKSSTMIVWCANHRHAKFLYITCSNYLYVAHHNLTQRKLYTTNKNSILFFISEFKTSIGINYNKSFEDHFTFEEELKSVFSRYNNRKTNYGRIKDEA